MIRTNHHLSSYEKRNYGKLFATVLKSFWCEMKCSWKILIVSNLDGKSDYVARLMINDVHAVKGKDQDSDVMNFKAFILVHVLARTMS